MFSQWAGTSPIMGAKGKRLTYEQPVAEGKLRPGVLPPRRWRSPRDSYPDPAQLEFPFIRRKP